MRNLFALFCLLTLQTFGQQCAPVAADIQQRYQPMPKAGSKTKHDHEEYNPSRQRIRTCRQSIRRQVETTVYLKSGPQTHPVKLSDILYLEKDSNYMTVHLKDKHILIRENMTSIFGLVPAAVLIRVHKSYMVVIRYIGLIEVHQLTIGGEKIPIGDTYRDAVRIALGMR